MPSRKRNGRTRRRRTRAPRAGVLTHQVAFGDNVDKYTTINVTTASLGLATDRPARVVRVRYEFSCVPDKDTQTTAHAPLLQFEVKAPSGNATPRMLYRSLPMMVPLGPVKRGIFSVPNAGFFQYDTAQTIVMTAIVSGSAGLAVTFNLFVTVEYDYKSYQGLDSLRNEPNLVINH